MDLYSSSPLRDVESMLFWSFSPEPFCLDDATTVSTAAPPPEVASRSAFASYTGPLAPMANASTTAMAGNDRNVHRRVIDLLRRIPRDEQAGAGPQGQGSRGFRHMMRERQRREKMSQCYADLHSILPHVQKGDKNSIVQTAAAYIQELKGRTEELRLRNEELTKKRRPRPESVDGEATTIKIREADPVSTVDSMIGALRCLKAMDAKARAISSEFSGCELTAVVSIQTKVGASEVERDSWIHGDRGKKMTSYFEERN